MPRPKKWRKVCSLPQFNKFCPENCIEDKTVTLLVEEYESIRLIDYMGFTQEECGKYMNIARATVQCIYNEARRKIAKALVEGYAIAINGGEYVLCRGEEKECLCGGCGRHTKR